MKWWPFGPGQDELIPREILHLMLRNASLAKEIESYCINSLIIYEEWLKYIYIYFIINIKIISFENVMRCISQDHMKYEITLVLIIRAPHIPLPNDLGQVKLPVGQEDLSKIFFYILYSRS